MNLPPTTTMIDCTVHATKPRYDAFVFFQVPGAGAGKKIQVLDTSK